MNLESLIKENKIFKGLNKNKMSNINTVDNKKKGQHILFVLLILISLLIFFSNFSIVNDNSLDRACRLVDNNAEYTKTYFPNNIICKQGNKIFEIKKNVKLNKIGE